MDSEKEKCKDYKRKWIAANHDSLKKQKQDEENHGGSVDVRCEEESLLSHPLKDIPFDVLCCYSSDDERRDSVQEIDFESAVLSKLNTIIKNQEVEICLLRQCLRTPKEDIPVTLDDVVPDPVDSVQQMDEFDRNLEKDHELSKKLVNALSTVGGRDIGDTMRRMIYKIGTAKLWCLYSVKGRGMKESFAATHLYQLVQKACQMIYPNVNEDEFQDAVAQTLKHAPNRKGGYRFKVKDRGSRYQASPSPSPQLSSATSLLPNSFDDTITT